MKIKVRPEDFIVQEKSELKLKQEPASFRIYELIKSQWDSLDLISYLARLLQIPLSDLSVAGLKDRYGKTTQLLAIRNRPELPAVIEEKNFVLRAKGYSDEKLRASNIKANEFRIVIRDIPYYQLPLLAENFKDALRYGLPNYYDEQRFGSARAGKGFMGKALFLGHMEEALRIYLSPSRADRREEKEFKKAVLNNWRHWQRVKAPVPPRYRPIFKVLTTFGKWEAFCKAVNAVGRQQLLLALHGYQSYLFNCVVNEYLLSLSQIHSDFKLIPFKYKYGSFLFYKYLSPQLLSLMEDKELPVPGFDSNPADPLVKSALERVLAQEGLKLGNLKVRKLHAKAVRSIWRHLLLKPQEAVWQEPAPDELYPGRYKLELSFTLRRGEYATIFIKRLALGTY